MTGAPLGPDPADPVDREPAGQQNSAPGSAEPLPTEARKRKTRWLFARVMVVQVVALIALWLLQATYGS